MLRTEENETEILLGNKQLLGIFVVVAVLLGISFAGGYMVGRGSGKKTSLSETATEAAHPQSGNGGETHTVAPDGASPESLKSPDGGSAADGGNTADQGAANSSRTEGAEPPLGSRHGKEAKAQPIRELKTDTKVESVPASSTETYTPHSGSQYLQVVAVGHDEAVGLADVLHKKGFRAHAVPKPGNNKLYRVIVGPIRDAGDLSSTRDALHNVGFREVIVQRY